jgi:hypothetical protein
MIVPFVSFLFPIGCIIVLFRIPTAGETILDVALTGKCGPNKEGTLHVLLSYVSTQVSQHLKLANVLVFDSHKY